MQLILNRDINFSMWELYIASFPSHERRTIEQHRKILTDSRFMPFDICDDDENLVGFFYCWDCDDFIYGEHFAVSSQARNRGIGKQALTLIKEFADNKTIIIEVEPSVNNITERRIEFYKREGFHINPHEYIHPSYTNMTPYLLNIMSYPRAISQHEFEKFRNFAFSVL